MNFLIVLSLFLVSQTVFAKRLLNVKKIPSLSAVTEHYLRSGQIFKLTFYADISKEWQVESLREINNSPILLEKARFLVEAEHGSEKFPHLEHMLKAQKIADTLDIDLHEMIFANAKMLGIDMHAIIFDRASKKEDLESAFDKIMQHLTRRYKRQKKATNDNATQDNPNGP